MNSQSQYFMFHGAERQTLNTPASTQLTVPAHAHHQQWNDWYRNCMVDAATAAAFPFSMGNDRSAQLLLPNFYSGFPQQTASPLAVAGKDAGACQSSFHPTPPLHGMMRTADVTQGNPGAMSGLVQRSATNFPVGTGLDGGGVQTPLPSGMYFPTAAPSNTSRFCSNDPVGMCTAGAAPSFGINSTVLDSQAATMVAQAAVLANHCSTNFYGAGSHGSTFFGGLPHQNNAMHPSMALASKPRQSPCLGVSSVVHHHPHHHVQQQQATQQQQQQQQQQQLASQSMMTHTGSGMASMVNAVDVNNGAVQVAYSPQSSVRSMPPYSNDSFESSKAHQGIAMTQGYPSPATHYSQQQQLSASQLDAHLQSSFLKGNYLQQQTATAQQQAVVMSQRNIVNGSVPSVSDPSSTCHLAEAGRLQSFSSQNVIQQQQQQQQQQHPGFMSSMGQQCFQHSQFLPNTTAVRMNEAAYKQFPSTTDCQPTTTGAMQSGMPNVCQGENVHKAHLQGQVLEQSATGGAMVPTVGKPKRRDRQRRKEREIAEVDQALNRHLTMLARNSRPADSVSLKYQTTKNYDGAPSRAPFAAEFLRAPFVLPIDRPSSSSSELLSRCASTSPVQFTYLPLSPTNDSSFVPGVWKGATIAHLYIKNPLEMVNSPVGTPGDSNSPSKKGGSNKVPVYKQQNRLEPVVGQSTGSVGSRDRGGSSPYNFNEYDFETTKPNSSSFLVNNSNNGATVLSPSSKLSGDRQERLIDDEVKQKLLNISTLHPELRSAVGTTSVLDAQAGSYPRLILRIPKECLNDANSQPCLDQEGRMRKRRRTKRKEANSEAPIVPAVISSRDDSCVKASTSNCLTNPFPFGQAACAITSGGNINAVDSKADSSSDSGIVCDSKEESPAFSGGQMEVVELPSAAGTQAAITEPFCSFGRPRGVGDEPIPKTSSVYPVSHSMQPTNCFEVMPTVKSQSQDEQSRGESQNSQGSEVSADAGAQIKQILEKKIRNLEKRRAKLIQVKEEMEKGKEIHPEQKKAIERVAEVDYQLEFSRDLLKNVLSVVQDQLGFPTYYLLQCHRLTKAQQRKEYRERMQAEQERMRDLLNMQELLNMLGSEDVRRNFTEGINGAVAISSENLALLDYLYQKICPSHDDLGPGDNWNLILEEAGECASLLVSGSQRLVPTTKVSFKSARMVIEQIQNCEFYKRRTIIDPDDGTAVVTNDGKSSINEGLSNSFGGLSMTITNGNLAGDCCAKASPEMLGHMHHGHLSFLQEDQTMLTGTQPHFNNMNFVPVGMNNVYPMAMGTIYSQSAVPLQGNHVVYASGLGIDMNNPICPPAASENAFDGSLPAAVVENRFVRQSQNVGYMDYMQAQQEVQQPVAQPQQQPFKEEPVNVVPPPSSTVEARNVVEDFTEPLEDDFSGFQDVRGSRSKMRRENKANNLTGHFADGGGPRGGGGGRFGGSRGRFAGRRGGFPLRGRRGASNSGEEYSQAAAGAGEVTFGRWEDHQESGTSVRGNRGQSGRGNFGRGGPRGSDHFGGRGGFQRGSGFGQAE
ncbi:hypothetical protein TTRE_0000615501 [Trichuris trichiura]|uniref:Caprin-1 dimerization domain-containing protein n=1 Tax=Trichuris trichiura TaxID=36087 RepID=A0A077ZDD0_TRITR|nr:hypothetical protein TTRE_0000615501 [Trichuris trichiura]